MNVSRRSITLREAQRIAQRILDETGPPGEMVIDHSQTLEYEFGWLFKPETAKFLKSGNIGDQIPGVGRIAVDRQTREAEFLPTNMPPERALELYIEEWAGKQPK
jgi:hypothetical protein